MANIQVAPGLDGRRTHHLVRSGIPLPIAFGLCLLLLLLHPSGLDSSGAPTVWAPALLAVPVAVTVWTFIRSGRVGLFAPGGLPNILVFLSTTYFVMPALFGGTLATANFWGRVVDQSVMELLLVVPVAFALGVTVRSSTPMLGRQLGDLSMEYPSKAPSGTDTSNLMKRAVPLARLILLVQVLFASGSFLSSTLAERGVNQVVRTPLDSVAGTLSILAVAAMVCLMVSSAVVGGRLLPVRFDYVLVGVAPLLGAARGDRSGVIALILLLLAFGLARGLVSWGHLMLVGFLMLALSVGVVVYRGSLAASSAWSLDSLIGTSLGSVTGTLLLVGTNVPAAFPYMFGSTYLTAVPALLPGFVTQMLFDGPPPTGTFVFRQIVYFDSPNAGLGFSFPAEAYLNFGYSGLVLFGFAAGALLVFGYSRVSTTTLRPGALIYFLAYAGFPLMWRSDALGQVKYLLGGCLALALFGALARSATKAERTDVGSDGLRRISQ